MPDHPTALLALLQRHGLTLAALEDMVHFCERRQTGQVILHYADGRFVLLEVHGKTKLSQAPQPSPKTSA